MSTIDRSNYLKTVRPELRSRYEVILKAYDEGRADIVFVTNHRRNETRCKILEESPIKLFHLEDLVQFIIDDIDGAMPRTSDLILSNIHAVLNADPQDSQVAALSAASRCGPSRFRKSGNLSTVPPANR